MKTRLLAIDLDGTLLNKEKKISQANIEAVKAAQDAGIIVVLASGRIRPSMLPFATTLGLDQGPMISGNGTHVMKGPQTDLYRLNMSHALMQILIDYANREDLHLNIYTADRLYFLRETPWGDLYRKRAETVVPELLGNPENELQYLKGMIVSDSNGLSAHRQRLVELFGDQPIRATESESEYLEFMDDRATKGYALATLAEALGIAQEETAAIGDYLNDYEMLKFAGISGAVGNAHPQLKEVAKVVVSPNEESGVSEFIHQIVLKQD